jgi:hypothetical protein
VSRNAQPGSSGRVSARSETDPRRAASKRAAITTLVIISRFARNYFVSEAGTRKRKSKKASRTLWITLAAIIAVVGVALAMISFRRSSVRENSFTKPQAHPDAGSGAESKPLSEIITMDVAKAVMVTVELDFGSKPPTIADALTQIERRYQPADGTGRTFSILDAYGEPTPDGKLHLSMHVSSEKPGMGLLVFKRTGEVLWRARINPTTQIVPEKRLTIFLADSSGKSYTVDGSTNPGSILDATLQESGMPVSSAWKDGEEREVTFIYSACGCPVKVMVARDGDRTRRRTDTPVIFPDDPAAVALISRLMRWYM